MNSRMPSDLERSIALQRQHSWQVRPRTRSPIFRSGAKTGSLSFLAITIVLGLLVFGCSIPRGASVGINSIERRDASGVGHYGIGRTPTYAEINAWNIDVMPDGEGLPEGSGRVAEGRELYAERCQNCHGPEGRGGPFDQLAGRLPDDDFPFAQDPGVKHTIGNYWPFATTIFDYTRRSMPYDRPGSLGDHEVYALTAYLLFLNELIDEKAVIDRESLPEVIMPSRDRLVPDDRFGGPEIR